MQVPLFADATMTDTDVIQTPSDRFHRWLLNFTSVVQGYRINELMVWSEDLQELLARPADEALKRQVTKAGTWIMLLHELNMMQSAFTRMLFRRTRVGRLQEAIRRYLDPLQAQAARYDRRERLLRAR